MKGAIEISRVRSELVPLFLLLISSHDKDATYPRNEILPAVTSGGAVDHQPLFAMSAVGDKVRVLVVEDSPSVQTLLRFVLERDTSIELVGIASSGAEALAMALSLRRM